jgi:ABC-2 type transport system ATP-binding protein
MTSFTPLIEVDGLTKRYGDKLAVDHLSFVVHPGAVTGFLGPNGAGKSTTMRMILGLDRPTSGSARLGGQRYADLSSPLTKVGALLEAKAVHGGRSARNHLLWLAQTQGLPSTRVDDVLHLVGLSGVAGKRAGKFSLGMSQRLGIAAALLGDPQIVLLDEPVNGLDPEGVLWIRMLMKDLAARGCTVFVSSHLMSEMALTAEHLVVIAKGRLVADCTVDEFIARNAERSVLVRTPEGQRFVELITREGASIAMTDAGFRVHGLPAQRIGELAARHSVVLHQLRTNEASLEEAFLNLTQDQVEYAGTGGEY